MNAARILVATDLSGPDRQCYAPAAELARRLDAPLTVIHVDEVAADRLEYSISGMEEYLEMVSAVRRVRVEQLLADFAALDSDVRFVIERGKPEDVIDAYARAHDVGLIVMAQHSTRGPLRKLLGSTTRRVIRLSDLPVLVVPVDDEQDQAASADRAARFERLLVPSDLSEISGHALRAAADLAGHLGADLTVTHALDVPNFVPIHGGEGFVTMPSATVEELKAHYQTRLADHITATLGRALPHTVVWGPSIVAAILDEAARTDADLICAPSSGKGRLRRIFLGSVTESLVKRSPIPVLVMPPTHLDAWRDTP